MSPTNAHHVHAVFNSCLGAAVRKKLLARNPIDDAEKVPAATKFDHEVLDDTQLVELVEGSFKLNQQKSDADHVNVAEALALQPDAGAGLIAADMRAMRPHVFAAQQSHDKARELSEGSEA